MKAQLTRPLASHAAPWFAVDALLEVARAYLALSDPRGRAGGPSGRLSRSFAAAPRSGSWWMSCPRWGSSSATPTATLAGSSTLTNAELRMLPLLPTYLSFQEIADRLLVSRNTVKTHAMSIYGKLQASSRGEAVERAVELGLLESFPGPRSRPSPSVGLTRGARPITAQRSRYGRSSGGRTAWNRR